MLNLDPERRFGELPLEARHSICLEISKKKRQSVSASIFLPKDYARKIRLRRCNTNNNNNSKKEKDKTNINHRSENKNKQQNESTLKKIRKLTKTSTKNKPTRISKQTKDDIVKMANLKHPESFPLGRTAYDNERVRDVMEQLKRNNDVTNTSAMQIECNVEQPREEEQQREEQELMESTEETGNLLDDNENQRENTSSPITTTTLEHQEQQQQRIIDIKQEVISDDEGVSQYYELEKVSYNEASDSVEMIYKMPTTTATATTDDYSNVSELTASNQEEEEDSEEHWPIGTFIPIVTEQQQQQLQTFTTTTTPTISTNEYRRENDLLLIGDNVPLADHMRERTSESRGVTSKRDEMHHAWHRPIPYSYYAAQRNSARESLRPARVNSPPPPPATYEFANLVATPPLRYIQPQAYESSYAHRTRETTTTTAAMTTTAHDQLTPPPSTDERVINYSSNFSHSPHPFLTPPPTVDTYNTPIDLSVTHHYHHQQQQQQQQHETYASIELQQHKQQKTRHHVRHRRQKHLQQQQQQPTISQIEMLQPSYNATCMPPNATTTTITLNTANPSLLATYNSAQLPNHHRVVPPLPSLPPPPIQLSQPPQPPPAVAVPLHHYNNNISNLQYYNMPALYRHPLPQPPQRIPNPLPPYAVWPTTTIAHFPPVNPMQQQQQQQLYEMAQQKLQQQQHQQQLHFPLHESRNQLQQLHRHLQHQQQLEQSARIQQESSRLQQQQQQQEQHALLQLPQFAEPIRLQQQQQQRDLMRLQQQQQQQRLQQKPTTRHKRKQQQQQTANLHLQQQQQGEAQLIRQQQREAQLSLQQQQMLLRLPQQPPATHVQLQQQQHQVLSAHPNFNSNEIQNPYNLPPLPSISSIDSYNRHDKTRWCYT